MSSTRSVPYEVARPTRVCAATGEPIPAGDRFVACLTTTPDSEEIERLDYSLAAWSGGARPAPPRLVFGTWRSVMPAEGAKGPVLLGPEEMLDLFEQLEGAEEPERLAFRYVLALLLVRKKQLVFVGDRGGSMLVRPKGADPEQPPMEVVDPGMDESRIVEVSQQLDALLADGGDDES